MSDKHHVIPQQRIKIAIGNVALKAKMQGEDALTDAERTLLVTPLTTILRDGRNIVRLSRTLHHRAHGGFERLDPRKLPTGIEDFAAEYALEWALEHELRLMREAA